MTVYVYILCTILYFHVVIGYFIIFFVSVLPALVRLIARYLIDLKLGFLFIFDFTIDYS